MSGFRDAPRPPTLDPANFLYWKQRMEGYIMAQGDDVWYSVIRGYNPPLKKIFSTYLSVPDT